jgi:hypothetical protein
MSYLRYLFLFAHIVFCFCIVFIRRVYLPYVASLPRLSIFDFPFGIL